MNVRHLRFAPLAAVAGFIATAPLATGAAWASNVDGQQKSMTLRYDPRDLNSEKGAQRLLSRISGAAGKVCDDGHRSMEQIFSSSYRACRHDAIARAVAGINRPTVTALYDRRLGQRGERGLHAALGARPVVEIQMVAVGWPESPDSATTAPAL